MDTQLMDHLNIIPFRHPIVGVCSTTNCTTASYFSEYFIDRWYGWGSLVDQTIYWNQMISSIIAITNGSFFLTLWAGVISILVLIFIVKFYSILDI